MIDALITGLSAGLVLPFLPGPVLFAIVRSSIEKGFKAGLSIAMGVLLADFLFIVLMLFGSELIPIAREYDTYNRIIGYIGGSLMIGIGIVYILKKAKLEYGENAPRVSRASFLLKGVFMSLFSPPTIIYWLTVTSIVTLQFKYTLEQKILFFTCLLATQIFIDILKAYYSSKLRNKITVKSIQRINHFAGGMLLLFGVRLLLEAFLGKKLF